MAVCVGAMMVGTIRTTVDEGDEVKRGREFGYFAFGIYLVYHMVIMAHASWYLQVAQL